MSIAFIIDISKSRIKEMSNPDFIIFIQLNHYCLTSEIIIVPVYGCELFTIPDCFNMYSYFVDYILQQKSCKDHLQEHCRIQQLDVDHDLHHMPVLQYFRHRDSYPHRWYMQGRLNSIICRRVDCSGGTYLHNHSQEYKCKLSIKLNIYLLCWYFQQNQCLNIKKICHTQHT